MRWFSFRWYLLCLLVWDRNRREEAWHSMPASSIIMELLVWLIILCFIAWGFLNARIS